MPLATELGRCRRCGAAEGEACNATLRGLGGAARGQLPPGVLDASHAVSAAAAASRMAAYVVVRVFKISPEA
ncbi:hypothetical protein [Streptomyces sp. NPDC047453]|uniref:hypothetical protein n=1 Tax=Streptomyces sp. NPDC047453 TaxID=3154812 RepID=UPI0033E99126